MVVDICLDDQKAARKQLEAKKNQHRQDCNEYELKFRNHEIHQNSSNRHHHTKTPSPEFSSNDSDAGFRA